MRVGLTLLALAVGVVLALLSYLVFAAPLGTPSDESFSNPRVPFAATLFVIGIALVFTSAIVYELLPSREEK